MCRPTQFQYISLFISDIPHDAADVEKGGKTHEFTNFPHSAADSDDEEAGDKDQVKMTRL